MSVKLPADFHWVPEQSYDSANLARDHERIVVLFPHTWAPGDMVETKLMPVNEVSGGLVLAIRKAQPQNVPQVSSGKILLEVHMDDIIQLRAKTEKAVAIEQRCGTWWKIIKATADKWFLRSLTRKEQGLTKLHNVYNENLWLEKQNDPHFDIVRVCPFPKDFNYKEYQ